MLFSGRHQLQIALAAMVLLSASCKDPTFIWGHDKNDRADLGVAPSTTDKSKSAAFRGTIGERAFYDGLAPLRVRGYGLVIGLGKNGCRECPPHIHRLLVKSMYKQHRFGSSEVGVRSLSPADLIKELDTAVVQVFAKIPPAATRGTTIDVSVRTIPGTTTKSLRGGRLFPADLEVFRDVSGRTPITGQILVRAGGPIFLNPFSDDESATKSSDKAGIILGGGTVRKDQQIRLVLVQPSYHIARRIQDRINAQFPSAGRVADAVSPSFVKLRIPPKFRRQPRHFLALIRQLYLTQEPTFKIKRTLRLARELRSPNAEHDKIALCFEGMGRSTLPELQKLYADANPDVSFHAAVAGVRIGDHLAVDALAQHARNASSTYRFRAVLALGESTEMRAAAVEIHELIKDEDPRIQVAAYEALTKRGDGGIQSSMIGNNNFYLDEVPEAGTNFVYAKRSNARRIAVFGSGLRLIPPVLYRSPNGRLTINAEAGDDKLTLLRTIASTGRSSPEIAVDLDFPKLIRLLGDRAAVDENDQVTGLGMDYGAVVRAIHALCQDRSVTGDLILEQPNIAEMFGPPRPAGRPESDL